MNPRSIKAAKGSDTAERAAKDDSTEPFNWEKYLKDNDAVAAPASCFKQHPTPPQNLFEIGMKLEATDPRCTSSICLATVMAKFGPRILLRLDGSGSSNDFWVSVDSNTIHPIGYTEKSGGMVQPPLGFQSDTLRWKSFLQNAISSSLSAQKQCFIEPPKSPGSNKFEVGMKLEAIDPKEPRMICPSTVVQVKNDKIEVMFDGWKIRQWYPYDSKHLFPVNWWQQIGVGVTPPPNKMRCVRGRCLPVYKKRTPSPVSSPATSASDVPECSSSSSSSSGSRSNSVHQQVSGADGTATVKRESEASLKFYPSSSLPSSTAAAAAHSSFGRKSDGAKASGSGCSHNHPRSCDAVIVDLFDSKLGPNVASLLSSRPSLGYSGPKYDTPVRNGSGVSEQFLSSFAADGSPLNDDTIQRDVMIGCDDSDATRKFCAFLNASCRAGAWLDPLKLCSAQRKFGPANLNHVMRMVVQTLIDCAMDVRAVFSAIPRGDGHVTVTADLNGVAYVRHLPVWGRAETAWVYMAELCRLLGCCPNLISRELDCKRCSMPESTHDPSFNNPHKKLKRIYEKDPNNWSVDEVFIFVSSVVDEQSAELFRKQEIDGSALFLLSNDMMIKYLNVRLGPAVKIAGAIEQMKASHKVGNQVNGRGTKS